MFSDPGALRRSGRTVTVHEEGETAATAPTKTPAAAVVGAAETPPDIKQSVGRGALADGAAAAASGSGWGDQPSEVQGLQVAAAAAEARAARRAEAAPAAEAEALEAAAAAAAGVGRGGGGPAPYVQQALDWLVPEDLVPTAAEASASVSPVSGMGREQMRAAMARGFGSTLVLLEEEDRAAVQGVPTRQQQHEEQPQQQQQQEEGEHHQQQQQQQQQQEEYHHQQQHQQQGDMYAEAWSQHLTDLNQGGKLQTARHSHHQQQQEEQQQWEQGYSRQGDVAGGTELGVVHPHLRPLQVRTQLLPASSQAGDVKGMDHAGLLLPGASAGQQTAPDLMSPGE